MKMIEGVDGNRTSVVEQMKNIYGLNYTGAAVLYQNYQDKVKEYGSDKKGLEEYFSGSEWEEELKSFQDNPNYKSNESLMLSYTADIRKYTTQIGQWRLDKKLPELFGSLKTAWDEAKKTGLTTDYGPGQHTNLGDTPPDDDEPITPIVPPTPTGDELAQAAREAHSGGELETAWKLSQQAKQAYYEEENAGKQRIIDAEQTRKVLFNGYLNGGTKEPAFFTNKFNLPGKSDPDQVAYENFLKFGDMPEGTESHQNFLKSLDILGTFTDVERQYVNNNNSVNTVVNDAMTDTTGQRLVELLTELRDNTRELHLDEI
jgi:hypothetical protein